VTLIVADTGPINYLIQIGHIELLAQLAEKTLLPACVQSELLHKGAPAAVRAWAASPPAWIEIRSPQDVIATNNISQADSEAISLAKELNASALLMDDSQARRVAARLGVTTIGTVGLLEAAAMRELISLKAALQKLSATSCFLTEAVIENALLRDAGRRRNR
jgi:predicted nucleic acid-binding protein